MKTIKKDVLIIGSGLSGLYTSLHLDTKLEVGIVSKDSLTQSNSALAQGGIASCINKEDSFSNHVNDTMIAGSNVNNIDAVSLLVSEAPKEIHKLIEMGVEFDKDENGLVLTTLEGGHSHKRVLHANGDATGKVIMETVVYQTLQKANIEVFEKTMAITICKNKQEEVVGVVVLNNQEFVFIQTRTVVIASGGVGALYRNTTNQKFSTGDGIALAKEIGCDLVDMCFIQFHPTAFYDPELSNRFLITEALRGEGAILKNMNNNRFMLDYDQRGDLAPRDVVSRGIYDQLKKNDSEHVWLDITHKDQEFLLNRFPTIYEFLKSKSIYMEKDFIPVAPVAHYFVGGISANLDGRTSVDGVYACGEVSSTGVHGANRLASNSLLECVVFGKRTAIDINKREFPRIEISDKEVDELINMNLTSNLAFVKNYICSNEELDVCDYYKYKEDIQKIMTQYVGIVRKDHELNIGFEEIESIESLLYKHGKVCSMYFEVLNMCVVAKAIIVDALNKSSLGCHYKIENSKVEVLA